MSAVEIVQSKATVYPNLGRYFIAELRAGKHWATVCVADGNEKVRGDVRVIVHNAANRAWRGMGRVFPSGAEALAHYRSDAVRSMVAVALAASDAGKAKAAA